MPDAIVCPICGYRNAPGTDRCTICSTELGGPFPDGGKETASAPEGVPDSSAAPAEKVVCPVCAFQNEPDAKYCMVCGRELKAPTAEPDLQPAGPQQAPTLVRQEKPDEPVDPICPTCGATLTPGQHFCIECGTPV